MHPSLEGRVLVPKDVFVLLCVEVKKLSDMLLDSAKAMASEMQHLPEKPMALNHMMLANVQLGVVEGLLRAIVEDDLPPAVPGGESGSGTGGYETHA